jgi:hypothetical protein
MPLTAHEKYTPHSLFIKSLTVNHLSVTVAYIDSIPYPGMDCHCFSEAVSVAAAVGAVYAPPHQKILAIYPYL